MTMPRMDWHRMRGTVPTATAITNVTATVLSETSAQVEWTLTAAATGQVEYGLTTSYGSTTTASVALLTYHSQTITGLTAATTYHFRVKSVAADGTVYSEDATFTTEGTVGETAGPRYAPAVPTGTLVVVIGTDTIAVDDTGVTDVTAKLQTIIDGLVAGSTLVFAQGDTEGYVHGTDSPVSEYRINGQLNLGMPNGVTLWGYGTRIRQYAGNLPTFALTRHDIDGLSILGFELYGSNAAWSRTTTAYSGLAGEAGHGIRLQRRHTNTLIEDNWVRHQNGDAINQPGWADTNWNITRWITVRHNWLDSCARMGIVCNVGLDWLVSWNISEHHGGAHMDAEDAKTTTSVLPSLTMVIEYNEFGPCMWEYAPFGNSPWCIHYGQGWNDTDGPPNYIVYGPIVIRDNTVTELTPDGLYNPATLRHNWFHMNQNLIGGTFYGQTRMAGLTITGNTFDLPAAQRIAYTQAALVGYVDGVTITGNAFQGTTVNTTALGIAANTSIVVSGNT